MSDLIFDLIPPASAFSCPASLTILRNRRHLGKYARLPPNEKITQFHAGWPRKSTAFCHAWPRSEQLDKSKWTCHLFDIFTSSFVKALMTSRRWVRPCVSLGAEDKWRISSQSLENREKLRALLIQRKYTFSSPVGASSTICTIRAEPKAFPVTLRHLSPHFWSNIPETLNQKRSEK